MTRPVFRRTPASPGHTSVIRNANSSAAWSRSSLDSATSHSERGTRRLLSSVTAGRSHPGRRSASSNLPPPPRRRSSAAAFRADAYAAAAAAEPATMSNDAPALPRTSSNPPRNTGPMRNTKSPAVFGSVNASPSPPLGALSCASAFTAGPAAAVPMPHSPMHSCSSWKSEESCATTRPAAHIARLATTTALSPILSATIPDNGADTIPRSAVTLNSSPTCAGVASSACVANHGMHVSLATKPSALAAAAAVMTRCLSDSRRTRQSLAALIASSSRSISATASISACRSTPSSAAKSISSGCGGGRRMNGFSSSSCRLTTSLKSSTARCEYALRADAGNVSPRIATKSVGVRPSIVVDSSGPSTALAALSHALLSHRKASSGRHSR
mmetsp:Transcript_13413/g.58595  ORF Transcript_13413/g.58595 Transcript_13413/m.58595 type:complete len:386 (-) Transcript_13413:176-1333(-)